MNAIAEVIWVVKKWQLERPNGEIGCLTLYVLCVGSEELI